MEKVILNVEGMSCAHCTKAVEKAVSSFQGVSDVLVNLNAKTVTFKYDNTKSSLDKIKRAIEDQGFEVVA